MKVKKLVKFLIIFIILVMFTLVFANITVNADGEINTMAFYIGGVDNSVPTSTKVGDMSLDGLVTARDAALIIEYIASYSSPAYSEQALINADVDGNNVVNINDATKIRSWHIGESQPYFDDSTHLFTINDEINLVVYEPNNSSSPVIWSTSDSSVATVDNTGKVKFLGDGIVKIKASNGTSYDEVKFIVERPSNDDNIIILEGKNKVTSKLKGDLNSDGLLTTRDYKLHNELVAHIIEPGYFTAQELQNADYNSNGQYDIEDTLEIDQRISRMIRHNENNSIDLNEVFVGSQVELQALDIQNVTWSSSDSSIATVDSSGKVNFLHEGDVTILATSENKVGTVYFTVLSNKNSSLVNSNNIGFKLEGQAIDSLDSVHTIEYTFDCSNFDTNIKGINSTVDIALNYTDYTAKYENITVESATDGWEITEQNKTDNGMNFIVEKSNLENNEKTNQVKVILKYSIPEVENASFEYVRAVVNTRYSDDNIKLSDYSGEVYEFPDVDMGIVLLRGYTAHKKDTDENIQIYDGRDIYVKMDGYNKAESYTRFSQLLEKVDFGNNNTFYQVKYDNDEPILGTNVTDINNIIVRTGTLKIKYNAVQDETEYRIFVLGDCRIADVKGIEINDVIALRKAIVRYSDIVEYPKAGYNFYKECSDVDGTNIVDGTRNTGDIGDVIQIRKRIINYEWDK